MDVHCSTCMEPWDACYLQQELITEIALRADEMRRWWRQPPTQRLTPAIRQALQNAGWEFGASVLDVRHCPACPAGARPHPDRVFFKAALTELLEDDEDGLAACLEDYEL